MNKKIDFYIYLLEKYSEYKNISTRDIFNKLEELKLTKFIINMYERYHSEAIENAFLDIDKLIKEKEDSLIEN